MSVDRPTYTVLPAAMLALTGTLFVLRLLAPDVLRIFPGDAAQFSPSTAASFLLLAVIASSITMRRKGNEKLADIVFVSSILVLGLTHTLSLTSVLVGVEGGLESIFLLSDGIGVTIVELFTRPSPLTSSLFAALSVVAILFSLSIVRRSGIFITGLTLTIIGGTGFMQYVAQGAAYGMVSSAATTQFSFITTTLFMLVGIGAMVGSKHILETQA